MPLGRGLDNRVLTDISLMTINEQSTKKLEQQFQHQVRSNYFLIKDITLSVLSLYHYYRSTRSFSLFFVLRYFQFTSSTSFQIGCRCLASLPSNCKFT